MTTPYRNAVLARSPVAYWRFGEAAGTVLEDAGVNNLDGTLAASGVTYGVAAELRDDSDTALSFDGSSNPATVVHNALLNLGDGPFTIEARVKRSASQGAAQTLVTKGSTTSLLQFGADDTLQLVKNGLGSYIARSSVAITDQLWHYVAVTKNGGDSRIYVDGLDVTVAGTAQTLANTSTVLRIGHLSAAGLSRFPGTLDELALYAEPLDAPTIAEHYRLGHPEGWVSYAPHRGPRRWAVPR
jgi:large repetitive protein